MNFPCIIIITAVLYLGMLGLQCWRRFHHSILTTVFFSLLHILFPRIINTEAFVHPIQHYHHCHGNVTRNGHLSIQKAFKNKKKRGQMSHHFSMMRQRQRQHSFFHLWSAGEAGSSVKHFYPETGTLRWGLGLHSHQIRHCGISGQGCVAFVRWGEGSCIINITVEHWHNSRVL